MLLVTGLMTACTTAPPLRHYTLASPAPAAVAVAAAAPVPTAASGPVVLAPIHLPAHLDRAQLVVRVAPNQVRLLEQDRWAAPLKEQVRDALLNGLAWQLPDRRIMDARDAGIPTGEAARTTRLELQFIRLDIIADVAVELEAIWFLSSAQAWLSPLQMPRPASSPNRAVMREALTAGGPAAAVAAHERALARLCAAIADSLRHRDTTLNQGYGTSSIGVQ